MANIARGTNATAGATSLVFQVLTFEFYIVSMCTRSYLMISRPGAVRELVGLVAWRAHFYVTLDVN